MEGGKRGGGGREDVVMVVGAAEVKGLEAEREAVVGGMAVAAGVGGGVEGMVAEVVVGVEGVTEVEMVGRSHTGTTSLHLPACCPKESASSRCLQESEQQ